MAELRFPVEIDDSQASKELNKLVNKIDKLKQNIAKTETARAPIVEQLKDAQNAAVGAYNKVERLKNALATSEAKTSVTGLTDPQTYMNELERQQQIKGKLAEQEKILQAKEKEAQKLEAADQKLLATLEAQTAELKESEAAAGDLTRTISKASDAQKLKTAFESVKTSISGGVKSLLKWGIGIRSLYVLLRKLREYTVEAVRSFAESDPETKANIDGLKNALAGLKASWGAAFAPVLNAVIPILRTLISWLTAAANAIAAFFAALSGKGSYKRAVASTGELSSNLGGAADNAKEAKKQLMGIDELNVMDDNTASGSGGGGGGGGGLEYEDVPVDTDSFTGQLALSFKDVLLDWTDLNGEQIAEKIIAGLGMLAGGVLGFAIGGVPGAIYGSLAGLTIGLIADALIFDHDGTLSANEIFKSLLVVLGALAGGVIGFSFGGFAGAAIGATIGVALALAVRDVGVEAMGAWSKTNLLEKFLTFLGGIVGGLIGFSVGGIAGAALGASIGIGLMLWVKGLDLSDVGWLQDVKRWLWDDGILAILNEMNNLIVQPIKNLCDKIVNKFNDLRGRLSNIVENIKSLFHFEFHMPTLRLPHIQVQWQDAGALAQFFGISALPHLSVAWYAKGGIVDGATLIGAGEQGKEAIVPLERNTQWVTMVARELADMLFDRDVFTEIADKISGIPTALDRMTAQLANIGNIPMPAVAMGTVAPPNATSSGYSYSALESKIDALLDRLGGLNGGSSKIEPSDIYLDKRKVGEVTYEYIQERERGQGK